MMHCGINGLRIIPTYRCNFNCSFCYQTKKTGTILDLEHLDSKLRKLNDDNFRPIYITLMGGEFTILENSIDYIKIVNKYFPFSRKSITTNGSATIEYYKKLRMFDIDNITFSLNLDVDGTSYGKLIDKIENINYTHLFSVRINIFLDFNQSEKINGILNYFIKYNKSIKITFSTDLRDLDKLYSIDEFFKILKINRNEWEIYEYSNHIVFRCERLNYSFWIFDHRKNYENDNYIIFPNGTMTSNFQDVINCYGSEVIK